MLKTTIKSVLARKRRLFTTSLAVLLGVAFMAGTFVLTDTIGKTFDDLYAQVNEGVDLHVRTASDGAGPLGERQRPRIDESVVDAVAEVEGVAAAEGSIQGYAQLIGDDGEPMGNPGLGAPTYGGSWPTTDALNPFTLSDGRPPTARGEVVIDRASAIDAGFEVGDTVRIVTQTGVHELTVVGIARFGQVDSPAGATYALFTAEEAQALVAAPGRFDAIEVVAASGVDTEALRQRVAAMVPDDVEVLTGPEITAEDQSDIRETLGFLGVFLTTFAVIALFVGSFIIYNTFSIIVAQRSKEMALFRAIGASRRQVLGSVLGEALAVGLVASLVGLVAGVGVAAGLKAVLTSFGIDIPAGGLVLSGRTVVASLAAGVLVTLLSALLPALRGARVLPVTAMRDQSVDAAGSSRLRAVIGVGVTTAGAALLTSGLLGAEAAFVGLGAAGVFVGIAVLGPVIARPLSRLLGSPLPRVQGMTGTLARENAMRNPKRTAATAAALMVGVGLVGFMTVVASSARVSIDSTIDRSFLGDLVVGSGDFGFGGLPTELAQRLSELPEVEAVAPIRSSAATIDGDDQLIVATATDQLGRIFDLGVSDGALDDLGADGIAVLDDIADDKGWTLGDPVPVQFPETGEQQLTVAAIYTASDIIGLDSYIIDLPAYEANVADQLDTQVFLELDDSADIGAARTAVQAVTDEYPTATLLDQTEFKEQQSAMVNQILNLVYVMLALAIVIALIGIANTLALSTFERTRELGLLRAVGMTRRQLRSMVRGEAVITALLGTSLGLAIGLFFGWSLVTAMRDVGFSTFSAAPVQLGLVATLAALGGMAAAIPPARRAAKLDVLRAIAAD